jgi:ADP-heptose:LPS heptosyltransferase
VVCSGIPAAWNQTCTAKTAVMIWVELMKILVKRAGAFGDVISITPITRRLRQAYPNAVIEVDTQYPEVFHGNTDVDKADRWHTPTQARNQHDYDVVHDLNGSYERRKRAEHGIDCYMEDVFGDRSGDKSLRMEPMPLPDWLYHYPQWEVLDQNKIIVIHPAISWQNRTMPQEFWQQVAWNLNAAGYHVVTTGMNHDRQLRDVFDLRGRLHPCQQVDLVRRAKAYIGSDCGTLFLAGTTDTPIVALFTTSPASMNIIWRHGEPNWRLTPVVPDLPCVGCTTREAERIWPEIVTYHGCERGDFACVSWFNADKVTELALGMACLN